MRSTLLLAAMLCLTLATSASASCAWVLWYVDDQAGYMIGASFESLAACNQKMSEPGLALKSKSTGVIRPFSESYPVCVPDSVDPRGPKGK